MNYFQFYFYYIIFDVFEYGDRKPNRTDTSRKNYLHHDENVRQPINHQLIEGPKIDYAVINSSLFCMINDRPSSQAKQMQHQ